MEVKEIQRLLSDRNLREISRRTNIGYSTLRAIVKNEDADPAISTVKNPPMSHYESPFGQVF